MNLTKKLGLMLIPKDFDETLDTNNGFSPGKVNRDLNLSNQKTSLENMNQPKMYGMTQSEIGDIRYDLGMLDVVYDKWAQEDDSLSGVLNSKLTKLKNADFRLKLDQWRARKIERKNAKSRKFQQGKVLRAELNNQKESFSLNKDIIVKCLRQFYEFDENFSSLLKDVKVINDFLCDLPEGQHQNIEEADLERLLKNNQVLFQQKYALIEDIMQSIRQECAVQANVTFNFAYVPETILKKKYAKKDYEFVIKFLKKVQIRYITKKLMHNPIESITPETYRMNDEDFVEFSIFDEITPQILNKHKEQQQRIQKFLNDCKQQILKTIQKLNVDSEKVKKNVEQSVLVTSINERMEKRHRDYFKYYFIFKNLFAQFAKGNDLGGTNISSPQEFQKIFSDAMMPHISSSSYYHDYNQKIDREMQKFNGKITVPEGAETNSEMTTATRQTK